MSIIDQIISQNKKNPKKKRDVVFVLLKYAFFIFLFLILLFSIVVIYYAKDLPLPEKFTEKPFAQSTKIYDRTGKVLLYEIYGEEKRQYVTIDKISSNLKNAVLATEDARFYQHGALDWTGIVRAVFVDITSLSKSQGASTITQQLVRSTFLTGEKSISRKIKEAILSFEMEGKYSKDQIFEWYLNQIPFGANAYGAEAASQTYFNKPASDLSLPEAATLAAIISSPSYLSPYGSHLNELLSRKDYVLNRMVETGFITKDQMQSAIKEKITFSTIKNAIKAPHFVFYVEKYLEDKYGQDYLQKKGLRVYTTLDWTLQQGVEDVVSTTAPENKSSNANNTAAVVLNPKTGEILALVGSKNYFGTSYPEGCNSAAGKCLFDPQFDIATLGKRQPGSSFKPFVYATAFEKGYTPNTILWDTPTEFNPNCSPDESQTKDSNGLDCYHPHDFDELYRGPINIRHALDQSLNIPAVKTLYLAGIPNSLKTAQDFGITTLTDPSRYGLSLVLGGGEVNLLEMASAYGVFADDGLKMAPVSILKIEDAGGNIIEDNTTKEPKRVLNSQIAREINDVLSDNNARVPAFVFNNPLYFKGHDVAAKTGTTSNYIDVWTMGYTPFAVVGVWAGNNDNSPINKKTGIGLAAPIWHAIMQKVLDANPKEDFIKPDPINTSTSILMGQLPANEYHDILYYVNKNDPLGPPPADPNQDADFPLWEFGVQAWINANQPNGPINMSGSNNTAIPLSSIIPQNYYHSPDDNPFDYGPSNIPTN